MFHLTINELRSTFEEINRILFFSQLNYQNIHIEIEALTNEYSYCYRELYDVYPTLGLTYEWENLAQFRFVLMYEMIRLYRYQIMDEEPKYDSLFSVFEYHGLKKITNIEDPHEEIELEN